jgi:tRNA 2-thiocytidine biosynthesis protein TtcA
MSTPNLEKLTRRLYSRVKRASQEHALLEPHDHILVCMSGGKDSYSMLRILLDLQERAPFPFKLTAFHLDQRQPGYPEGVIDDYLASLHIPYVVLREDTYSVVTDKLAPHATPCSLCSRLRRGIIYTQAEQLGCNKIALGHHRDDSIETMLLNMFYTGQLQAMPASYTTDDGRFKVIRPLIYCAEDEIAQFAALHAFPIIPCNLCGSVDKQRKWVKSLLLQIEETIPAVRHSMLASLQHVRATHLLDRNLLNRLEAARDLDLPEQEIGDDAEIEEMIKPKKPVSSHAEDLLF